MQHLNINKIKIPGVKTAIGIISGKGGVGKTFVATCLAGTLAKLGKKTAVLDADINCSNIFKTFGITKKITQTGDNKIIPIEKWGIKIVGMAGLCASEDEPVVWRGPIISRIVQQLLKETMWGDPDVLVIDFPTGTSDVFLTTLQNFVIDALIVVTTPQDLATLDAKRAINAATMMKVPVLGVIENMRGEIFGEGGGSRVADAFHLQFLGSIPMRKQIVSLSDHGMPPVFQMEELEMIFAKLARIIVEKVMV